MARRVPNAAGVITSLLLYAFMAQSAAPVASQPATEKTGAAPWKLGDPVVPEGKANARGAEIFSARCAVCHEHAAGHAPAVYILKIMTPASIYGALTTGAMRVQAQALSDEDKRAVVEFLAGGNVHGNARLAPPPCQGAAAKFDWSRPPTEAGWGLTPGNTRLVATNAAGLDATNLKRLKLKWALGLDGAVRVRSQPAMAGGAIYLGSQDGRIYALDQETGCERWQYAAAAEVRTGIVASPWDAMDTTAKPMLYFGDIVGNVYAVDAVSGHLSWRDHTDAHPSTTLTATPALSGDRLYVPTSSLEEGVAGATYDCCTFRGSVISYDALTGKRIWQQFMVGKPKFRERKSTGARMYGPSGVAIWGTPAIDAKRGVAYVGTGDNYSSPGTRLSDAVVALDLRSGSIKWAYQATKQDAWNAGCVMTGVTSCPKENGPDSDFGAAPLLAVGTDGRDYVIAGAKSGWVYALDPDRGTRVWKTQVGRGGILAGVYFGMASRGDAVFVPINDADDGRVHTDAARPGLYALDVHTGRYLWKSQTDQSTCNGRGPLCAAGIAAPATATDDLVLTGGSDGWLRIYAADSGQVLWQYDTLQDVTTVGGGTARGGSIGGGAGLIVHDGMVIAESGYGFAGRIPGNVMLVFSIN